MLASKARWFGGARRERRGRPSGPLAPGGLLLALGLAAGCASPPPGPPPQAAALTTSRVSDSELPERPRLRLVDREGDPSGGVALAVHVGAGASAAFGLALLAEARVRDAGLEAAVHPGATGFIVYALVSSEEDVRRFVSVSNAALLAPATAADAARVAARWRAAPPRRAVAASEAAIARCSGELLLEPGAEGPNDVPARLATWLEAVRVSDAAFAVVGSGDVLDAAADALAALAPWPRPGASTGLLFEGGLAGARPAPTTHQSLSVALWGLPAAAAVASAERLAEPGSMLATRLGAGFPSWQVARVASHLYRGGACLRLDLHATGAPPGMAALAGSAEDAVDELDYTLARADSGPWIVTKQVLVTEGPEQAAAVAAWQAVTEREPPAGGSRERRLVFYSGPLAENAGGEGEAGSLAIESGADLPELESRQAVESGQGQLWMLLASPCGTGAEDGASAGALALALHAVALGHDGARGVALEPWLNVDGMGLLAHAGPAGPGEHPGARAERVAEALMAALLNAGPPPEDIAASREILLDALPSGAAPGLALALRQSTSNHPSYLDARGTWASLTALSARSAQLERSRFLRSRLRLASLGDHDSAQVELGERRLRALLRSVDPEPVDCPPRAPAGPVPGRYVIDSSSARDADAVVAIALPPSRGGPSEEARWTEWLMNRPGGWLQQALQRPGLVSTARARVLGGSGAAALVIEVRAVDDRHEEAVAQVRGLLQRLRAGAATPADVASAREQLGQAERRRRLNPRGRLVDLWLGSRSSPATLDSLHALHRAAFEAGREVVVMTRAGR